VEAAARRQRWAESSRRSSGGLDQRSDPARARSAASRRRGRKHGCVKTADKWNRPDSTAAAIEDRSSAKQVDFAHARVVGERGLKFAMGHHGAGECVAGSTGHGWAVTRIATVRARGRKLRQGRFSTLGSTSVQWATAECFRNRVPGIERQSGWQRRGRLNGAISGLKARPGTGLVR